MAEEHTKTEAETRGQATAREHWKLPVDKWRQHEPADNLDIGLPVSKTVRE